MKVNMNLARSVMGVLAAVSAAVAFSGCVAGPAYVSHAWYDVYGTYCYTSTAPGPGCDFFADDSKATYWDDPNVAPLNYGTWSYVDVYGYNRYYTGYARVTATGMMYDENGYAINSTTKQGRDVLVNAAAAQKAAINGAAQGLEAKYGLSDDVAQNIATSLNEWALIGKSRKRTDADVAAFSQRLTGLDINEVNAAIDAAAQGNNTATDAAMEKAAAAWSTSPDTMKQIVSDWYGQQIAGSAAAN